MNTIANGRMEASRAGAGSAYKKLKIFTNIYTEEPKQKIRCRRRRDSWLFRITATVRSHKPEEASTHRSAKSHAGNVSKTRDLDLWHFDRKINEFSGLIVEHFCVKFGGPRCIGFWDIVRKNRQTDRQTNKRRWKSYPANTVGIGN